MEKKKKINQSTVLLTFFLSFLLLFICCLFVDFLLTSVGTYLGRYLAVFLLMAEGYRELHRSGEVGERRVA